jgi:raffinose/stachyose/melibiose transport system substrate-binding protein
MRKRRTLAALAAVALALRSPPVLYNKELLAKAGATTVPRTWDEFLALCHKLKGAGDTMDLRRTV